MGYFTSFPYIAGYRLNGGVHNMVDVSSRTTFDTEFKNNPRVYFEYTIGDGETPIMIADKLYNDVDLFWIVLMFNDIHNVYDEWPVPEADLFDLIEEKYPSKSHRDTHHYEAMSNGIIVDPEIYPKDDTRRVTIFEYESGLNDKKRAIRLPIPEIVSEIVTAHEKSLRGS